MSSDIRHIFALVIEPGGIISRGAWAIAPGGEVVAAPGIERWPQVVSVDSHGVVLDTGASLPYGRFGAGRGLPKGSRIAYFNTEMSLHLATIAQRSMLRASRIPVTERDYFGSFHPSPSVSVL